MRKGILARTSEEHRVKIFKGIVFCDSEHFEMLLEINSKNTSIMQVVIDELSESVQHFLEK